MYSQYQVEKAMSKFFDMTMGGERVAHLDFISLIGSESFNLKTLQGFRLIFAHTSRCLTKPKNQKLGLGLHCV
jgi:hypothetical protein